MHIDTSRSASGYHYRQPAEGIANRQGITPLNHSLVQGGAVESEPDYGRAAGTTMDENKKSPIYVDAENIPEYLVSDIFRIPPSIPSSFRRSTMIVGARGSGKTFLFRHLQSEHEGIALHITLSEDLAPISTQTGEGPLCYISNEKYLSSAPGMASALLAVGIIRRLTEMGIPINESIRSGLIECLPGSARAIPTKIDQSSITNIYQDINTRDISEFKGISEHRALSRLVSSIGKYLSEVGKPLLLLLDKPDQISPLSLTPVVHLLDQSNSYIALIATRPGQTGRALEQMSQIVVPGDHYNLLQLGGYPRSSDWRQFMEEALSAQLSRNDVNDRAFRSLDAKRLDWILSVSRDSVRTALELVDTLLPANGLEDDRLRRAAHDRQEDVLSALRRSKTEAPDSSALFREIRKELKRYDPIAASEALCIPADLKIVRSAEDDFFRQGDGVDRFVDSALRCSALSMPEGETWFPGARPERLEISPIVLWERNDPLEVQRPAIAPTIYRTEKQIRVPEMHVVKRRNKIFIAYDFQSSESKGFRLDIEQRINSHPTFGNFDVIDGGLLPGEANWTEAIRKRIKESKIIVADLSRRRPEVVYEIGLAFGLSKERLFVTKTREERELLPNWLTQGQFGSFDTARGMDFVVAGLEQLVLQPSSRNEGAKLPTTIPGRAAILNPYDWAQDDLQGARSALISAGIQIIDCAEPYTSEVVRNLVSSTLIIGCIDGSDRDAFVHYICGALAARPSSSQRIGRKIFLIIKPGLKGELVVSESLRRQREISIMPGPEVVNQSHKFSETYRRWSTSMDRGKG